MRQAGTRPAHRGVEQERRSYWQPGTTMDAGYSRCASVLASAIMPMPPPKRMLPQNMPPNSELADCMTCFPSGVLHETRRVSSDFGMVTAPGGWTVQDPFLWVNVQTVPAGQPGAWTSMVAVLVGDDGGAARQSGKAEGEGACGACAAKGAHAEAPRG